MNPRILIEDCLKKSDYPFITATDISTYIKSPFNLWANKFAPKDEKDAIPEYLEILFQQGIDHENDIVNKKYPEIREIKFRTKYEGFKILINEFFMAGKAFHGMPLYYMPESFLAQPDIIEINKNHKSIFGNFHYTIKEIKLAKRIKKEHVMQAIFSNYLIGKIQNYFPEEVILINKDEEEIPFAYEEWTGELLDAIREAREIANGKYTSPDIGNIYDPWKSYALKLAEKSKDLSLLNSLGHMKKQILLNSGVKNLYDLASMEVKSDIDMLTKDNLDKLKISAKCYLDKKHLFLKKIKMPSVETELFIDFESSTGLEIENYAGNIDYLIGVLKRDKGNEEVIHFLAESLEDEEKMLNRFIDFIKKQKNFVMYHFGIYEVIRFRELFAKYDVDKEAQELVLNNMIDLLKIARENVIFPLSSYSLKSIAPYLGFRWRLEDIDARQSLVLYMDYIKNNNKESIKKILIYNEDDLIATRIVKDFFEREA
ncbi:MAG: TM0106 family RecB-like putative nuclease [Nanoarchaeota archaeon]